MDSNAAPPRSSNRAHVRTWIQKLGTDGHLAFSGQGILLCALFHCIMCMHTSKIQMHTLHC